MSSQRNVSFAVVAALLAFAAPASAGTRADAPPSARYGEPSFGHAAPGAPAIPMRGPASEDSLARREPTWPAPGRLAPAIPLGSYVADAPLSPVENDGPPQRVRTFAALDGAGVP